jgi:hypothetical protein
MLAKPKSPAAAAAPVDLQRRRITVAAALALLGAPAVTLTACGGGATGPNPVPTPLGPSCPADAACGVVTGDPSHSATITGAQLAAGGALVLDIRGAASHNHTVSLSADEVTAIRARQRVSKTSSPTLGHQHEVTFN